MQRNLYNKLLAGISPLAVSTIIISSLCSCSAGYKGKVEKQLRNDLKSEFVDVKEWSDTVMLPQGYVEGVITVETSNGNKEMMFLTKDGSTSVSDNPTSIAMAKSDISRK